MCAPVDPLGLSLAQLLAVQINTTDGINSKSVIAALNLICFLAWILYILASIFS